MWAQRELYRGQCNCSYWHGAFGGIYLPHLRNAVYNHLIAADNLLDKATANGHSNGHVEATVDDYNFDARQEVCLLNDKLVALLAPASGGQMYELDVRSICHNALATLVPPARSLSPQGVGRSVGRRRRLRQHPRPRGLQTSRTGPPAALRPLSPQEPGRSLLRQRR